MARLRKTAERLRTAPPVRDDSSLDGDSASAEPDYESWTLARLRRRAAELDVTGRSAMDKAELIAALRAHPEPDDTRRDG